MKLPVSITSAPYVGAWAMDIDADGDLDIILGSKHGEPTVLRNNGDGTWLAIHPFKGIDGAVQLAIADVNGDGNPDVAIADAAGKLHVFMNLRAGIFKERPVPPNAGGISALAAADLRGDGRMAFVTLNTSGAIFRLADISNGTAWDTSLVAQWSPAPRDIAGDDSLLIADLDNNGGPRYHRIVCLPGSGLVMRRRPRLCAACPRDFRKCNGTRQTRFRWTLRPDWHLADGKPQRLVNSGSNELSLAGTASAPGRHRVIQSAIGKKSEFVWNRRRNGGARRTAL